MTMKTFEEVDSRNSPEEVCLHTFYVLLLTTHTITSTTDADEMVVVQRKAVFYVDEVVVGCDVGRTSEHQNAGKKE